MAKANAASARRQTIPGAGGGLAWFSVQVNRSVIAFGGTAASAARFWTERIDDIGTQVLWR